MHFDLDKNGLQTPEEVEFGHIEAKWWANIPLSEFRQAFDLDKSTFEEQYQGRFHLKKTLLAIKNPSLQAERLSVRVEEETLIKDTKARRRRRCDPAMSIRYIQKQALN